jgi:hypothetical protein
LYKGAVFLFAEEAGNAAIAEENLFRAGNYTREDIENYMGVSRRAEGRRKGLRH